MCQVWWPCSPVGLEAEGDPRGLLRGRCGAAFEVSECWKDETAWLGKAAQRQVFCREHRLGQVTQPPQNGLASEAG